MTDLPLHATFSERSLDERLRWLAEPARWLYDPEAGRLQVWPDARTDFWQRTHYGFEADNGHFLHLQATGDFVLGTCVTAHPRHQYDQAGLMLRVSPTCWVKTSVEFEPTGPSRLGVVVTQGGYSDWSTRPLDPAIDTVCFRLRAEGEDVIVDTSLDGQAWEQARMAHLAERAAVARVACGLYACSPQEAGFRAEFHYLRFEPGRVT